MIRGRKITSKEIVHKIDMTLNALIHNRFDIEVVDVNTGKVKQKAKAFNVVCNNLWDILFAHSTGYFRCIHYGSGSGTPSSVDTSLFNFVGQGYADPMTVSVDFVNGLIIGKGSIQLSASTAVGVTITEVGIAGDKSASTLCTHAMLQDMNGNQISIEKTDTDIINIYATVFVHFSPEGYDNGHIHIIGDSWNWTNFTWGTRVYDFMPALVGSHGPSSGCSALMYAGHNVRNDLSSYATVSTTRNWDRENKRITIVANRLENTAGNFEGILHMALGDSHGSNYLHYPEIVIEPGGSWFTHSEIVGEAVGTGDGTTKDFSLDFPYARDVKIYVDGVEQTGFTVDYGDPRAMKSNCESYRAVKWLREESTDDNHIPFMPYFYGTNGSKCDNCKLFYHRMHEVGAASIGCRSGTTIYASNDLIDWVEIGTNQSSGSMAVNVPEEYRHYKYFKCSGNFYSDSTTLKTDYSIVNFPDTFTGNVVHLENAPASGSVITADYKSDCIAKDANHVFDFSLVIQLGEYTEAQ